jgi:hypothetical protein
MKEYILCGKCLVWISVLFLRNALGKMRKALRNGLFKGEEKNLKKKCLRAVEKRGYIGGKMGWY